MKKLSALILGCAILLTSCSFDITKDDVENAKHVFSEQIDNLYELYENGGKEILSNLSIDKAKEMVNDIIEKIPEDKKELAYKGIEKGVELVEDGKEILVNELSVDVSLEGMKEEIEEFLESLANIDARISVGDLVIEKIDDNYKLDCTINFYYSSEKEKDNE